MRVFVARILFDLQQEVVEKCLFFAEKEDDQRKKDELLDAAKKAVEMEKVFLVHIPRN